MSSRQQHNRWKSAASAPGVALGTASPDGRPVFRVCTIDTITVVDILNAENLFAEEAIADLAAQLRSLVEGGHTRLVLNFRGVRSMSSDVLATLAGLHRRLEKVGGRLGLARPDAMLRDMLRICGLDRLFDIDCDAAGESEHSGPFSLTGAADLSRDGYP